MMKPEEYTRFWNALYSRNMELINTPESYRLCHYLPEAYNIIEKYTPKTVWVKVKSNPDFGEIMNALKPFGNNSVILKDFVKSQKHLWKEACFIPCADDEKQVRSVVSRFLELQGKDLNEGLVFREYVRLVQIGVHPASKMPLFKEYRLFFLNNKLVIVFPYWKDADYGEAIPWTSPFVEIAKQIKSNFFTMDIAQKENGDWIIIELGDGQVAGLPDDLHADEFYSQLYSALQTADY